MFFSISDFCSKTSVDNVEGEGVYYGASLVLQSRSVSC